MRLRNFLRGTSLVAALGLSMWLVACSSPGSANTTGTTGSSANPRPAASTPAANTASPAGQGSQATSAISGGEINITLKDRAFLPEEIKVKAGAKVVFVIANKGTDNHTFELPDFKVLKELEAGKSLRLEWTVPDKKGSWDVGCFLTAPAGVHDGMEGILIIE